MPAAASRSPRRDQALRVTVRPDAAGTLRAQTTGAQGSHILSSLLHADALAIIPQGDGELGAGASVALHALAR
jgi:molybdopterin molybdotransferase